MPTTSSTGRMAATRSSPTSSCSAATITAWCTRAAIASSHVRAAARPFRRPDGSAIPTVPRNRPASAHRLLQENVDAGLRITDETPVARSAGERLCYDIEIEGLLWREGLLRLGWAGSTPEELRRGSAEPQAAGTKVLT